MTLIKYRISSIIRNDWPGILVVMVAIGLRLYRLSAQPLWLDEIFTVQLSRQSLLVILQDSFREPNPPLYHLLEMLAAGIWNVQSEWGWRWLSAIAGILTISGFYLLCRRFTSRIAATFASLAFAILPFHVYYSQEARSFAITTLLAVWSTILLVDILSSDRSLRWWVALAVLSILGVYTSYFYILIVGVQGLVLWFRAPRRAWWIYAVFMIFSFIPVYLMVISTISNTVSKRANMLALTPVAILQSLAGEPVRFGINWQNWLLLIVVSGIALLGIFTAFRNKSIRLLVLYFCLQSAIPILFLVVLDTAFGIRLPQFETRQFLIFLPALFSLFAFGLDFLFSHVGKIIPIAIFVSIMVASLVGLQAYWRLIKSPESVLVLNIRPELKSTDSVISLDYYTAAASYFYLPGNRVINYLRQKNGIYQFTENLLLFPIIPSEDIPVAEDSIQDIRNSPRFWVLNRDGINTEVMDSLTRGCNQEESFSVSRFTASLWGYCQP